MVGNAMRRHGAEREVAEEGEEKGSVEVITKSELPGRDEKL